MVRGGSLVGDANGGSADISGVRSLQSQGNICSLYLGALNEAAVGRAIVRLLEGRDTKCRSHVRAISQTLTHGSLETQVIRESLNYPREKSMSRYVPIIAVLGTVGLACSPSTISLAQLPAPAASILLEPTVGAGLDMLESRVKDTMNYGRQIGDFIIWRAGETALQTIGAWKEANSRLLKEANDKLDDQQRQFLNSIDFGMVELRSGVRDADRRARDLTVMWSQMVASLPITGGAAKIYMMTPQALLADGDAIRFSLKGPNLAKANVQFFVGDKEFPVTPSTDFEVVSVVPRNAFPFEPSDDEIVSVSVKFDANPDGLFSKGRQSRSFEVWLLPQELGTVAIVENVPHQDKTTSHFDTVAQATGKDQHIPVGVSILPHLMNDRWKIDTAQIAAAGGVTVIAAAGEKGSCNGASLSNLTETGMTYNIHISHTTKKGRKRGGWQHCHIRVPIYRMTETNVQKIVEPIKLSWTKDRSYRLSPNSKPEMRVVLFDDRVYENVDASTSMRYLRVLRSGDTLTFNPRPPTDF